MEITFTINLQDDERELLTDILNCSEDELCTKLGYVSKASLNEYTRMILGQKVFNRGQDIKEFRLFLLIQYLFEGKIPDEKMISTLFQTTNSESRSLLKSVLAKYQYNLRAAVKETIEIVLTTPQYVSYNTDKDLFYVTGVPINIIDEMNLILNSINGSLEQITKKRGAVQSHVIKPSSYDELCDYFEVTGVSTVDE